MQTVAYNGADAKAMIQKLPTDQINHLINVGVYVGVMARNLAVIWKCSEEFSTYQLDLFSEAALYHDIGKVWIPRDILFKPGILNSDELSKVRKHTLLALDIFRYIIDGVITGIPARIVPLACDAAVYHHEWWNGSGYPFGMSRKDIPLIARVTSICDAYDAMTSDRAYRKASSHEYACCEIKAKAGTQFDPALAEVFLNNDVDFINAFSKNPDISKRLSNLL